MRLIVCLTFLIGLTPIPFAHADVFDGLKLHSETKQQYERQYRQLARSKQPVLRTLRADIDYLARHHQLQPRLRLMMDTVERNLQWKPASYGVRRVDPATGITWQWYTASGWQLQQLANWGEVHRLLKVRSWRPSAYALADRLLEYATIRGINRAATDRADINKILEKHSATTLALEYMFDWDGGEPGWVSAMATASAMKACATIAQQTGDPTYEQIARNMAKLIRSTTLRTGRFFLLYSQQPRLIVANGWASTLVSLYDYTQLVDDKPTAKLLDESIEQARLTLPQFYRHGGSWYSLSIPAKKRISRYEQYTGTFKRGQPATAAYHQLLVGFVTSLCARAGEPFCSLS